MTTDIFSTALVDKNDTTCLTLTNQSVNTMNKWKMITVDRTHSLNRDYILLSVTYQHPITNCSSMDTLYPVTNNQTCRKKAEACTIQQDDCNIDKNNVCQYNCTCTGLHCDVAIFLPKDTNTISVCEINIIPLSKSYNILHGRL